MGLLFDETNNILLKESYDSILLGVIKNSILLGFLLVVLKSMGLLVCCPLRYLN